MRLKTAALLTILWLVRSSLAAQDLSSPQIGLAFNLEGPSAAFGPYAYHGAAAAFEVLERDFAKIGVHPVARAIDLGEWLNRPNWRDIDNQAAGRLRLDAFLEAGGRILFGADTTGSTDRLLVYLDDWAKRKEAESEGEFSDRIIVFAPVATSELEEWNQRRRLSRHVSAYRTAVADSQELEKLFFQRLRERVELTYDFLENQRVIPSLLEYRNHMAVVAEGTQTQVMPREKMSRADLHENREEWPVNAYVGGFLENLNAALHQNGDYGGLAKDILVWKLSEDGSTVPEEVKSWAKDVVADPGVRSVAIVGYAPFVKTANGLLLSLIEGDQPERSLPQALFRFTGGAVKLKHLLYPTPEDQGSFDGIHLFRTLPADEYLSLDERDLLTQLAARLPENIKQASSNLAQEIDDHTLHSYLAGLILLRTLERTKSASGLPPTAAALDEALAGLVAEGSSRPIRIPFYGNVSFTNGDINAVRHIFYARASGNQYSIMQVDGVAESGFPWTLTIVLAIGFGAALLTLINWGALTRRKKRNLDPLGIPNPYIYGCPVTKPELFFGRRNDFRRLVDEIKKGPFVLLITGGRRSGKSSFLHFISLGGLPGLPDHPEDAVAIPPQVVPVPFDMQEEASYPTEEGFLAFLRGGVERALAERGVRVEPPAEERDNEYQRITDLLHGVRRERPEMSVLILLDEIELLNERMAKGTLSPNFTLYLKARVEDPRCRLSVVLTGSPLEHLPQETRAFWSKLEGLLQRLNLGPLSKAECKALASEPVKDSVAVPESVQEEVHRLTGGQPFLTQAICHMGINALNIEGHTKLPAPFTLETLEQAVADFVQNTPGHVDDMWSRFSDREQYLLLLLARCLNENHDSATLAEIHDFAAVQQLSVGNPSDAKEDKAWRKTLEELCVQGGILEAIPPDTPAGSYRYRFLINLFRRWLRQKPIWPVVEKLQSGIETKTLPRQ